MNAVQAACIVGAIAFTGVIFQIGRNTPDATVPGAMPEAAITLGAPAPPPPCRRHPPGLK